MTDNTQAELTKNNIANLLYKYAGIEDKRDTSAVIRTIFENAATEIAKRHNKQIEAYHNELTDNDKKVWIYADDLEKRKAKAVEEVLDRLEEDLENTPLAYAVEAGNERNAWNTVSVHEAIEAERTKLKEVK